MLASPQVYRGILADGKSIAVKKLDRRGMQGDREFSIEVNLLNALRHPNIVRLLGICTEGDHRLAVFELATLVRAQTCR
jgi:serine/threonine protein kinase